MPMPPVLPGAQVVAFDDAAANAAIAAVDDLAAALRSAGYTEGLEAVDVAIDWSGPSREGFDHRRSDLTDEIDRAKRGLQSLRDALEAAKAKAAADQGACNDEQRRTEARLAEERNRQMLELRAAHERALEPGR